MADPRHNEPRDGDFPPHPANPDLNPAYRDPAADPRLADHGAPPPSGARTGLIAAGVIAALLVIALIAFSGGPGTDSGTTAVIPDQSEEMAPPIEPGVSPDATMEPAAPAPLDTAPSDLQ